MPLRRRRSHHQQLTEFERGREQWSRDDTASRKQGSVWPRGTNEREARRIRSTTVSHRTASATENPAAVGTTLTKQTFRIRLLQEQPQA
ncbi:transposable element Tc1 transposase [Trichonephila clavipes]|nr:transposable element Tc1 transposase [Trichonephila clavipes]